VNTAQQEVIRKKLIEARKNIWFKNGERIFGKGSSAPYRLLQFPSTPFRYSAIVLTDSGTWKTQKIIEILTKEDTHIWSGVVTFRVPYSVRSTTLETLKEFLSTAFFSQERLFLDLDLGFWSEDYPEWMLTYRSSSVIEQHTAEGMVTKKGYAVCYITVEGSALVEKIR